MKLCKDCVHYQSAWGEFSESCFETKTGISLVDGKQNYLARNPSAYRESKCGKEAVFYIRKWWKFWRPSTVS